MEDEARTDCFAQFTPADVRALIEEYPLAWVVSRGKGAASLLPLVGVYDAQDRLSSLIGHFARRNPLHRALADDPRAIILFNGPQGYIGTEMAVRSNWAPTWNYAQVRIEAEITLAPEMTEDALQVLLEAMQGDVTPRWDPSELGQRYSGMVRQIVGFSGKIVTLEGRFKLGQDEDVETLRSILEKTSDLDFKRWMMRFNRERLDDHGTHASKH